MQNRLRTAGFGLCALAVLLYIVWLAFPITIITADIGRHVLSGNLMLESWSSFWSVTHQNVFTYTFPEYTIINHHWLTGVIFAVAHNLTGWVGLHLLFIALNVTALLLFMDTGRRLSNPLIVGVVTLVLLTLIAEREELRPEVFGALFTGLYLWVCVRIQQGTLSTKILWWLVPVQLLWVNVHISFPLGLAIILLFGGCAVWQQRTRAVLLAWLYPYLAMDLITLVNPAGVQGAFLPLRVFQDFGYPLIENQSLWFLYNWGLENLNLVVLPVVTVITVALLAIAALQQTLKPLLPLALFTGAVTLLAWLAMRQWTLAGLCLVPLLSAVVSSMKWGALRQYRIVLAGAVVLITAVVNYQQLSQRWIAIGLEPGANNAARFIEEQGITGPWFNNFDIAGYLIYHFYPEQQLFVDNRPEAHPPEFFREVYIPMQQDPVVWQQQLAEHNFNALVLYYRDRTQWFQEFLNARLADGAFVPVFADQNIIVFVRNTQQNQAIISQHRINIQNQL